MGFWASSLPCLKTCHPLRGSPRRTLFDECLGGQPRGSNNFTPPLKTCNSSGAPRQAPLERLWVACSQTSSSTGSSAPLLIKSAPTSSSQRASEKPRIRLGCMVRNPSRSAFSQAARKLFLVDFGRKEYGYRASWSGSTGGVSSTPRSPTLTVRLVVPKRGRFITRWRFESLQTAIQDILQLRRDFTVGA